MIPVRMIHGTGLPRKAVNLTRPIEAPDAFHFPGHGDIADGRAAIGVAFHASHHDLIA